MPRSTKSSVRYRRRRSVGSDGAAAVEFAMVLPLLILLVLGVADYGVLTGSEAALEGAARAGAEVAKAHPGVSAATLTGMGLFPASATPAVAAVCTCADGTWPAGTACPPDPTKAPPCAATVNPFTGASDPRVVQYVDVSGTQSFSPLAGYASFAFPASLTGRAFTRTQ